MLTEVAELLHTMRRSITLCRCRNIGSARTWRLISSQAVHGEDSKRAAGLVGLQSPRAAEIGATRSRAAPCAPVRARSKASRTRSPGMGRSARVRDGRLRTNIGDVLTLDAAVAAFNPLCACPIPNASRLACQAR